MKILLMGPPACGKGTQGELLSAELGVPLIASGQLLRELPESHPHYAELHKFMDSGGLPDNKIVAQVIKHRLNSPDCAKGYILDGWGRRSSDIDVFNPDFDLVILINIPREESLKRITGRRVCETDGKTYNIYTLPEEEIKKCQGALIQRPDDTEEVVNTRLDIYESETMTTINRFRKEGKLVEVIGIGTPSEVFEELKAKLQKVKLY